jgi:hypothetical protein
MTDECYADALVCSRLRSHVAEAEHIETEFTIRTQRAAKLTSVEVRLSNSLTATDVPCQVAGYILPNPPQPIFFLRSTFTSQDVTSHGGSPCTYLPVCRWRTRIVYCINFCSLLEVVMRLTAYGKGNTSANWGENKCKSRCLLQCDQHRYHHVLLGVRQLESIRRLYVILSQLQEKSLERCVVLTLHHIGSLKPMTKVD